MKVKVLLLETKKGNFQREKLGIVKHEEFPIISPGVSGGAVYRQGNLLFISICSSIHEPT